MIHTTETGSLPVPIELAKLFTIALTLSGEVAAKEPIDTFTLSLYLLTAGVPQGNVKDYRVFDKTAAAIEVLSKNEDAWYPQGVIEPGRINSLEEREIVRDGIRAAGVAVNTILAGVGFLNRPIIRGADHVQTLTFPQVTQKLVEMV